MCKCLNPEPSWQTFYPILVSGSTRIRRKDFRFRTCSYSTRKHEKRRTLLLTRLTVSVIISPTIHFHPIKPAALKPTPNNHPYSPYIHKVIKSLHIFSSRKCTGEREVELNFPVPALIFLDLIYDVFFILCVFYILFVFVFLRTAVGG